MTGREGDEGPRPVLISKDKTALLMDFQEKKKSFIEIGQNLGISAYFAAAIAMQENGKTAPYDLFEKKAPEKIAKKLSTSGLLFLSALTGMARKDVRDVFMRIPGVGKKTADEIVEFLVGTGLSLESPHETEIFFEREGAFEQSIISVSARLPVLGQRVLASTGGRFRQAIFSGLVWRATSTGRPILRGVTHWAELPPEPPPTFCPCCGQPIKNPARSP